MIDSHFAYEDRLETGISMPKPLINKSSMVTADKELRHAPTVPKLAAKILQKEEKVF